MPTYDPSAADKEEEPPSSAAADRPTQDVHLSRTEEINKFDFRFRAGSGPQSTVTFPVPSGAKGGKASITFEFA